MYAVTKQLKDGVLMDEKWQQYEEKVKALKKQFLKQYLKVWAVFIIYNIVADVAIYLLRGIMTEPIAIVAFLVSTGLSFYIALKSVVDLKNIKTAQENKLMEDAPIGKIRI
ncbi:MAG: hypothetical protein UIG59_00540 [Acutalibacteraceae bacterium]|nr:hypothetical protein [Acutalibacteraceae bacterium]